MMNASKWYLSILILLLVVGCGENNKGTNVLNVEQVLNKPNNYLNKNISIQGIVNKVNEDKNIFSVISEKEFNECGLGECNVNDQLPVRFSGELPGLGEKVEIAGIVKKNEKGFIYEAESVRNIKNL
ncbi:hypothetical protein MNBD_IGNAVI01-166 [hydrothermal vent metagenome]|uniref:Lipoprotein n=1 Tax=hydrothermal vent metagenome TaxID=652676 RepID=A0A3B1DL91_9ZZZZ